MTLVAVGFAAGLVSGMGVGGGAILIPCLTLFMGMEQRAAQGINLLYFIPTALAAVITHVRQGNVTLRRVRAMALFGLLGAAGGAVLAFACEQELLRTCFGYFLLLMGVVEFFRKEG